MQMKVEQKKERQLSILHTIDQLGFASRTHIQKIHDLSSTRNANRVLRDMGQYLYSVRPDAGEQIFYLNQTGRDMIGSEKEMKKTMQIDHYLMRNDMYIFLGCPEDWRLEHPLKVEVIQNDNGISFGGMNLKKEIKFIADASCNINQVRHYIEVDNVQQMKENKKKIEQYSILRKAKEFTLIFYTSSDIRQNKLYEWCKEYGLLARVYTKKDIL